MISIVAGAPGGADTSVFQNVLGTMAMLKVTFISGILLGLAGVLSGAGFYPWIDHERLESRTAVVPNGGRREAFVIRLPVDHIASLGAERLGLGAAAFPSGLELPESLAGVPVRVDHFKIRDSAGHVVGIAARHTVALSEAVPVTWSLSFPSRGALWLVGQSDPAAIEASAAAAGHQRGEAWSGELDFLVGGPAGQVRGGTEEFEALVGNFVERWQVTGISETGELRGTIELDTTIFLAQ